MPDMSGYETIAVLSTIRGGERSYIVALTGLDDAANMRAINSDGFNEHLVKPVSMRAVTAALARYV